MRGASRRAASQLAAAAASAAIATPIMMERCPYQTSWRPDQDFKKATKS
jgi:hypothetical protein